MNFQQLGEELKGDLGLSCLSSVNFLELAKGIMEILNEMIKPSVKNLFYVFRLKWQTIYIIYFKPLLTC